MKFSRQEHWSGLPFPSPGDLPDPGIGPESPALAGEFFTPETPGKPAAHTLQAQMSHSPAHPQHGGKRGPGERIPTE